MYTRVSVLAMCIGTRPLSCRHRQWYQFRTAVARYSVCGRDIPKVNYHVHNEDTNTLIHEGYFPFRQHSWHKLTHVAFHLKFVSNSDDTLRFCSGGELERVLPKNTSLPLYFNRIWACTWAIFINVYEKIDCIKNDNGKYYVL